MGVEITKTGEGNKEIHVIVKIYCKKQKENLRNNNKTSGNQKIRVREENPEKEVKGFWIEGKQTNG